jgi:hypothetical protein
MEPFHSVLFASVPLQSLLQILPNSSVAPIASRRIDVLGCHVFDYLLLGYRIFLPGFLIVCIPILPGGRLQPDRFTFVEEELGSE